MARIAITGATGLAGGAAARALMAAGHEVIGITRDGAKASGPFTRHVPDLSDAPAMESAIEGCAGILHFADRADRASYAEHDVGSAATILTALRTVAAAAGIARIVFASSVHAATGVDRYARSKQAAEAVAMAPGPGSRAIVLRLPPLHGPGAKGAVRHIANMVARGLPLPLGLATANRRFLSLDALGGLCVTLADLPDRRFAAAAGRIWYPSDPNDHSLAALARSMGGGRTRLWPVPFVDRLFSGTIPVHQSDEERNSLFEATGWRAGI